METNLNCDLGETSIHHSAENDPELMKLINTANIACGFHAGDEETMRKTVDLALNIMLVLVHTRVLLIKKILEEKELI
tara:strand:+ start:413 stop:646 length:234 start_codon:yes stop_codon:yes gene_type:complete